jgi:ribosomal protein S18 acetylase RimI-like enzyme
MIIRPATKHDLPAIANLYALFWGDQSDLAAMEKRFEDMERIGNHVLLCAEYDGKIIGTIMGNICPDFYGTCDPYLVMENLITHPDYRHMGAAGKLLIELEHIGKTKNCTQIIFITEKDRKDAIGFYESQGYDSKSHVGFKKGLG